MIYKLAAKQLFEYYERNYSYLGLISNGYKADYTFLYVIIVGWQVLSIALSFFLQEKYITSFSFAWWICFIALLLSLGLSILFIYYWVKRKHNDLKGSHSQFFDGDILNPGKLFEYRISKIKEYLTNNNLIGHEAILGIVEDMEEEKTNAQRRNVGKLVLAGGIIAMIWNDIRTAYLIALGVHGSKYESYFVLAICIIAFFTINALIGSVKEMEYGKWIHYRDLIYVLKKINQSTA